MLRGVGEIEFLQRLVPDWMALPVALLTQLGDAWFLSLLLAVAYWVRASEREVLAAVSGVALAGFALLDTLKHVFALPRPDYPLLPVEALPALVRPLYEATALAAGYGFPSGHAMTSTIVYLGLAHVLAVSTRRRRFAVAGVVIALVSLSRIVLGVHFLVDVVAGVGFGLLFLGVAGAALARLPDRATAALGFAVLMAGLNLVVSDAHPDAVLLAGASLGGFGGWQVVLLARDRHAAASLSTVLRSNPHRVIGAVAALAALAVALGNGAVILAYGGALGLAVAAFLALPETRAPDSGPSGI